jgi:3-oxoacyl-[acyl-carrier protein] reductase
MDLRFSGKVVAVTGGSRGIGLAVAAALASEGASLAIAARSPTDLASAHRTIEAAGGRCLAYACDLARPGEAAGFIDAVTETFGRLDGLVCNAGTATGGGLLESRREEWEASFALNLFHAVEALQTGVPALRASRGCALFVSSISGRKPVETRWHYASAKAALIHAARSLALELAEEGIRVNAIAPGSTLFDGGGWARRSVEDARRFEAFVARELPAGRLATPQEIADVATFLLSERASWINGAVIPVDGGQGRPSW